MLGKYVTAKVKGQDDTRQGAVVSVFPLVILGQSGEEHECEGVPTEVMNPPDKCIGCDLPLGALCGRCERNLMALDNAMSANGLKFERVEVFVK
jgi:hypothetical protein